jgi:predicted nuclease of predicted toxin-antitoxin system
VRLLLDNNVPKELAGLLMGHAIRHARDKGWERLSNGLLVKAANEEFDVLLTFDQDMPFQTSLRGLSLCVFVIDTRSVAMPDILPRIDEINLALQSPTKGTFQWIKLS